MAEPTAGSPTPPSPAGPASAPGTSAAAPTAGGTKPAKAARPARRHSVFREFLHFIRAEKKWWMIPLFLVGALLGSLLLLGDKAGPLSVLIYPFF